MLRLSPTDLQQAFIESPAFETTYGGARGGGKSFALILDWLVHSETYGAKARGLAVRRHLTELDELISTAQDILLPAGHVWHDSKKMFTSPSGATLRMRYLDNDQDALLYQGHQYTRVYIDELTHFPNPSPIYKLFATLRSAAGVPAQFKATTNPGGPGHSWVKLRYVDCTPPMTPYSDDNGETYRVFIPAKLSDNRYLIEADPQYVARLRRSGGPDLVKAWLDGDWEISIGSFFPEWNSRTHVLPTFEPPESWGPRFRAMDWGSARPYAVGWFAIASGDPLEEPYENLVIPRGAMVMYRELYGWTGEPNVGTRETAEAVGRKIALAEAGEKLSSGLNKIDPSTFATNGGPSIAENLARAGAWFTRADNRRVAGKGAMGGWEQIRARLVGIDGRPMLYFMDCCRHTIRTLPALPTDAAYPEDVDSESEDHAPDMVRYACNARIWVPPRSKMSAPVRPRLPWDGMTLDMLYEDRHVGTNQFHEAPPR